MTKKGIFGGSFDPIHLGHINLARAAMEKVGLDSLTLIPAASSPFKVGMAQATPAQRLEMCKIAVAGEMNMDVSDIEIADGGISYTYKTVQRLSKPGEELFLLVGSDAFLTLQDWKYPQLILQRVIVISGCRGDEGEREKLYKQADFLSAIGFGVELVDYQPLPVSSTRIRQMLADKESTEGLLDPAVREYIDKNGLYR